MQDPRRNVYAWFYSTPGTSRRAFRWAADQPGWVARAAASAAVLVVSALVLLLIIPALLVGVLVFALLSLYVAVRLRLARWRGVRETESGRENVRVIRRPDDPR